MIKVGRINERLKGFCFNNKGAALTEFALVLPILVVFMGFIGEFSRAIYQYHVAEKGVKSAARYLARIPDVTSCTASAFDSYKSNAVQLAQRGSFNSSEPVLSNWDDASEVKVDVTCIANPVDTTTQQSQFYGPTQIPIITVSTSFEFNDLGMLNIIKALRSNSQDRGKIEISASHSEAYVGD